MAELPDRYHPRELRASDADREQVAAVLRQGAAEGRLDLAELDERLSQVYAARTYADLEPLVADLPTTSGPAQPRPGPQLRAVGPPTSGGAVAIMSEFNRRGPWRVRRVFSCLAFWGGGNLDLREAILTEGQLTIRAFAIMGGINVTVPTDAEVHVTGLGLMGGFDQAASGAGAPGAPCIVVTGLAFWGGVNVKRRARGGASERDGQR